VLATIIESHDDAELDLADALAKLRAAAPEFEPRRRSTKEGLPAAEIEDLRSALAVIPNDEDDWNHWSEIGGAIHQATDGEGLQLFHEWSAKWVSPEGDHYDPDVTDTKWDRLDHSPYTRKDGAAAIFALAKAADPTWLSPSHQAARVITYPDPLPPPGRRARHSRL
jgi:hypothetical protein